MKKNVREGSEAESSELITVQLNTIKKKKVKKRQNRNENKRKCFPRAHTLGWGVNGEGCSQSSVILHPTIDGRSRQVNSYGQKMTEKEREERGRKEIDGAMIMMTWLVVIISRPQDTYIGTYRHIQLAI